MVNIEQPAVGGHRKGSVGIVGTGERIDNNLTRQGNKFGRPVIVGPIQGMQTPQSVYRRNIQAR